MSPVSDGSNLVAEWMRVVSRLSSKVIGGKIVGMRFASIVLPAPGEPTRSMLWTLSGQNNYVGPESTNQPGRPDSIESFVGETFRIGCG